MKIINLNCKMTNCYLIEISCGWIMIDTDFPQTLHPLMHLLRLHNIKISDIKYLIATHYHPDHAGIAQDLKNLGVCLILHKWQVSYVNKLNDFFKRNPKYKFTEIVSRNNMVVSAAESRKLLEDVGIKGEIIQTTGHSDDSISLIIDENCAFTGDLPRFELIEAFDDQTIKDSWKAINDYKVKKVYPAHGDSYSIT